MGKGTNLELLEELEMANIWKMLNSSSCQGNVNQYSEVLSPGPVRMIVTNSDRHFNLCRERAWSFGGLPRRASPTQSNPCLRATDGDLHFILKISFQGHPHQQLVEQRCVQLPMGCV